MTYIPKNIIPAYISSIFGSFQLSWSHPRPPPHSVEIVEWPWMLMGNFIVMVLVWMTCTIHDPWMDDEKWSRGYFELLFTAAADDYDYSLVGNLCTELPDTQCHSDTHERTIVLDDVHQSTLVIIKQHTANECRSINGTTTARTEVSSLVVIIMF